LKIKVRSEAEIKLKSEVKNEAKSKAKKKAKNNAKSPSSRNFEKQLSQFDRLLKEEKVSLLSVRLTT